jgi:hypothetical protein
MFVVEERGIQGNKEIEINGHRVTLPCNDIREIAVINSDNKKYKNKSVYLISEKLLNKADPKLQDIDYENMISEVKTKNGRMGKRIRKSDLESLRVALEGNIPDEDIDDFIDYMLSSNPDNEKVPKDERKKSIKKIFISCKDYYHRGQFNNLFFNDLGEDGCLIPLPIVNMSKDQIKYIRNGSTTYLKFESVAPDCRYIHIGVKGPEASGVGKWKLCKVEGDVTEELKNANNKLISEGKQIGFIYNPDEQKLSEDEKNKVNDLLMKLSEENNERGLAPYGGKELEATNSPLGFEKYEPTGEEMIEICYSYGPNRSGKTFYASKYAKLWSEIFEGWPIYLFSRREKDAVLDEIPTLNRVAIDEKLLSEPLTMDDFEYSLVIFDDIDTIVNKEIRDAIQKMRDDIMETGRQKLIYVINTSHLGMNYRCTRTVLNEANSYTLFPRKGNYEHNVKILKDKMGIKPSVIKDTILGKPNGIAYRGKWGWITVYKDSPQYLIFENGVCFL